MANMRKRSLVSRPLQLNPLGKSLMTLSESELAALILYGDEIKVFCERSCQSITRLDQDAVLLPGLLLGYLSTFMHRTL